MKKFIMLNVVPIDEILLIFRERAPAAARQEVLPAIGAAIIVRR